ncbi:MAG TPA: 4-hydroxyphenylacetate 3-hydroxylase N-terminal domain-containing protein [Dehalococcoidia bacterium]|nr:4-hydroxyphenylacetate 3-hydroxylase N-terminal domain-containing protein [Dehalococcoidia bacterium]
MVAEATAIRRGEEYLASLRDGRLVWFEGEWVADVTSHPGLSEFAHTLAEFYDLHHDPELMPLLTMKSPTSGNLISASYLLPRSSEDLARRRQNVEFWARRCGGTAARLPDHMAFINNGIYDARKLVERVNPEYAENMVRWYEMVRENDLFQATCFSDPPRDRLRPAGDPELPKVVQRTENGIVVRGVKSVSTIGVVANELFCLNTARQKIPPEETIFFAIPLNTPGLRIVCRNRVTPDNPEEHPLAPFWDEMDATMIFDDVFVPRERIFYAPEEEPDDPNFAVRLFSNTLNWALWGTLTRTTVKTETLLGIVAALTDYLGTSKQMPVQLAIADMVVYVEALRALIVAAERQPWTTPSGFLAPNASLVTVGRTMITERHSQILESVRELAGSGLLMSPNQADLANPRIGPLLRQFFVGRDERAEERFRMQKLAWDYVADSFGGRQLVFEIYNSRGTIDNKLSLLQGYDLRPHIEQAKKLAGIETEKPSQD